VSTDRHIVRLLGLPVELHWRASATSEALMREFAVITSDPVHQTGIPGRLLALVADLTARYPSAGESNVERLRDAALRGLPAIDLVYEVPAEVAAASEELKRMLAEADGFCRDGAQLLTLAPPDDEVAYRNWFLDEFVLQIGGGEPRRWSASAAAAAGPCDDAAETPATEPAPASGDGSAAPAEGTMRSSGDRDGVEVVVAFSDAIDLESSATLRAAVTDLRDQGYERIVLDIGEVSFVDSVGLSVLVAVHRRLSEDGGHLVLRRPTRPVAKVLEISGLVGLLDVES
jgi:anti-anti-sigma factor